MRKSFVAPQLIEQQSLAALTLMAAVSGIPSCATNPNLC